MIPLQQRCGVWLGCCSTLTPSLILSLVDLQLRSGSLSYFMTQCWSSFNCWTDGLDSKTLWHTEELLFSCSLTFGWICWDKLLNVLHFKWSESCAQTDGQQNKTTPDVSSPHLNPPDMQTTKASAFIRWSADQVRWLSSTWLLLTLLFSI